MKDAKEILENIEKLSQERKNEILFSKDSLDIKGTTYFISNQGCDENDGLSPERPWKTLEKVSSAELKYGDGVLFKRGDLFRGFVQTRAGVSYGAYGVGEKPKFHGGHKDLADPCLWELYDEKHSIWRLKEPILDCGTLVFDHGSAHSRKLIPSYIGGKFVCREDESRDFDMSKEMTLDLDLFCPYDERLTDKPSKGQNFPIPKLDDESLGELYLRCDKGNPAEVFDSIEALPRQHMFKVGKNENVKIDNLCLKYVGMHAISAGGECVKGLHVTNCEIGWVGGCIQHYFGTDPNYPQGGRGSVTRFGNGVEIYGGCDDYLVENCYIYQVYDAGITHQVSTFGKTYNMKNVRYIKNLVEYCVYSIEYFLEKTEDNNESLIENCEMSENILRFSGYGWGQQRHNYHTPAHVKGWSYENTAVNFSISNNIFDRSAYRMLHLVAKKEESLPKMSGNVYIQHLGGTLGQYGANEASEPEILMFDINSPKHIQSIFSDTEAKVYYT